MSTLSTKSYDYTFANGLKASGTISVLEDTARKLGFVLDYKVLGVRPRGFYPSVSKGLIKIANMHEFHVRQAINKRVKDYLTEKCNKDVTNKQYVSNFMSMADDEVLIDLFADLQTRK